jgi:hypothetical protein
LTILPVQDTEMKVFGGDAKHGQKLAVLVDSPVFFFLQVKARIADLAPGLLVSVARKAKLVSTNGADLRPFAHRRVV